MTAIMDKVLTDIQNLSSKEKSIVAQSILSSLDEHNGETSEKEWAELSKKRYDEIISGEVETLNWDEIKQQVLKK